MLIYRLKVPALARVQMSACSSLALEYSRNTTKAPSRDVPVPDELVLTAAFKRYSSLSTAAFTGLNTAAGEINKQQEWKRLEIKPWNRS